MRLAAWLSAQRVTCVKQYVVFKYKYGYETNALNALSNCIPLNVAALSISSIAHLYAEAVACGENRSQQKKMR